MRFVAAECFAHLASREAKSASRKLTKMSAATPVEDPLNMHDEAVALVARPQGRPVQTGVLMVPYARHWL